ncbi:MAG: hypothetical protein M3Y65_25550 [Pseudomonadota bacterium]|nr:hypothetical protein [Pseudomonadota bacterium]
MPFTTIAFGAGCVKTKELEIFIGRITLPDLKKSHSKRFETPTVLFAVFPHVLHSLDPKQNFSTAELGKTLAAHAELATQKR